MWPDCNGGRQRAIRWLGIAALLLTPVAAQTNIATSGPPAVPPAAPAVRQALERSHSAAAVAGFDESQWLWERWHEALCDVEWDIAGRLLWSNCDGAAVPTRLAFLAHYYGALIPTQAAVIDHTIADDPAISGKHCAAVEANICTQRTMGKAVQLTDSIAREIIDQGAATKSFYQLASLEATRTIWKAYGDAACRNVAALQLGSSAQCQMQLMLEEARWLATIYDLWLPNPPDAAETVGHASSYLPRAVDFNHSWPSGLADPTRACYGADAYGKHEAMAGVAQVERAVAEQFGFQAAATFRQAFDGALGAIAATSPANRSAAWALQLEFLPWAYRPLASDWPLAGPERSFLPSPAISGQDCQRLGVDDLLCLVGGDSRSRVHARAEELLNRMRATKLDPTWYPADPKVTAAAWVRYREAACATLAPLHQMGGTGYPDSGACQEMISRQLIELLPEEIKAMHGAGQ